jgi:hypothetical protein
MQAQPNAVTLGKVRVLRTRAEERDHTVGDLAFAWLLRLPEVSTAIAGASNVAKIEASARAADWRLHPEELAQIDAALGQRIDGNYDILFAFERNFDTLGAPSGAGMQFVTWRSAYGVQSETTFFFSVARLISDLSHVLTLEAGDIILTGTPSGVGASRKPPEFLGDGDVVECRVDRIGTLRNTVRASKGEGG